MEDTSLRPKLYFEAYNLNKALDKTKLVQKEVVVHGKNGTHTRKQWVSATKDSKDDNSSKNQTLEDIWKIPTDNPKNVIVDLLTSGNDKSSIMEFAKRHGVVWKESSHEGINWMRASQSIQKHFTNTPSNSLKDTFVKEVSKPKNTQSNPTKNSSQEQLKVQELTIELGNEKLLEKAKKLGVTWDENSHKGINLMRGKMAIVKALEKNSKLFDDFKGDITLDSNSKEEGKEKLKNESEKDGSEIKFKSDYERDNFGDILKSSNPEELLRYRTLGMCAGDANSAEYLKQLYDKYTKVMTQEEKVQRQKDTVRVPLNPFTDPLTSPLTGVVNLGIAKVVQESIVNIRSKVKKTQSRAFILSHWCNPLGFTDEDKQEIKNTHAYQVKQRKIEIASQKEGEKYLMMKAILDKLNKHPEYKGTALEFKNLVEDFEKCTEGSAFLQKYSVIRDGKPKEEAQKIIDDKIKEKEEAQKDYDFWKKEVAERPTDYHKHNLEVATKELKYLENQIESAQKFVNSSDYTTKVKRAKEIFKAMGDSKYENILINLIHDKKVSTEITAQYYTDKDFIKEYPVLTNSNIDVLNSGDQNALSNLSLYAGLFKPSLGNDVQKAKDILNDKLRIRNAYLTAYGGVTQVSTDTSDDKKSGAYAEDIEVRCKISSASPEVTKRITDKIRADWDNDAHGNMKFQIQGVYEISNLAVENDFNEIKNNNANFTETIGGKKCDTDLFYHGTGSMATSLILGHTGEFKIVKAKVGRMLGDGIYLADKASKSAQYIGDDGYSRHNISGSLMIVEASLGNTVAKRGDVKNCDSVFAGKKQGLLNNEWCVHNPKAVIPRYLVQMKLD